MREVLSAVGLRGQSTNHVDQLFCFQNVSGRRVVLGTIVEFDYEAVTQTLTLFTNARAQLSCKIEWSTASPDEPARAIVPDAVRWQFLASGRGRHEGTVVFPTH